MPEPERQAFLDANVLRGHLQTDVLLTLADHGAFDPRWSAEVLDEVRRNRPPGLSEDAIDRRLNAMNKAFPRAMVTGYEHLMPEMQADAKDKHVLAAAVHSQSTELVTENVKDFDPPATGPHAMKVDKTSAFLNKLVSDNPGRVVAAMKQMISRTSREPNTLPALIEKLAKQQDLKGFAERLNAVVPPEQRSTEVGQTNVLPGSASSVEKSPASIALDGVAPAAGATKASTSKPESSKPLQREGKGPDIER